MSATTDTAALQALADEFDAATAVVEAIRERQRTACLDALASGCPVAAVARDARVTRVTLHAWQRAAGQRL